MQGRGMLTESAQAIARDFLGREITTKELRLYPYLQFCAINPNQFSRQRVNAEEMKIIDQLIDERHMLIGDNVILTRKFYDYINNMLAECYVPMFLELECDKTGKQHTLKPAL